MNGFGCSAGRVAASAVVVVGVLVATSLYAEREKVSDSVTYIFGGDVFDSEDTKVPGALVYYISEGDTLKGKTNRNGHYAITVPLVSSVSGQNFPIPFSLGQNFPNPFNPSTPYGSFAPSLPRFDWMCSTSSANMS